MLELAVDGFITTQRTMGGVESRLKEKKKKKVYFFSITDVRKHFIGHIIIPITITTIRSENR